MPKNVALGDTLIQFLDYYRDKWGHGNPLSYTKTIQRFIQATNEEEIYSFSIVKAFERLQSELPSSYSQILQYSKALILKAHTTDKLNETAEAINKLLNFKELWEMESNVSV